MRSRLSRPCQFSVERAFRVVLQQCMLNKSSLDDLICYPGWCELYCANLSRNVQNAPCQLALIDFVMASKRKFNIILTILEVWYSKEYSKWFCQTLKIDIVLSLFKLNGQLALTEFSKAGKWNSTWYFLSNNFISKHSAPLYPWQVSYAINLQLLTIPDLFYLLILYFLQIISMYIKIKIKLKCIIKLK